MGKLLLYNAGRIAQSLQRLTYSASTSPTNVSYKGTDGTSYTTMLFHTNTSSTTTANMRASMRNVLIFDELTGYVSADTETDFDISDYTTNALSNVAYSRTDAITANGKIITLAVTNNGASPVTVGSVKFTKPISTTASTAVTDCLVMGYFLNTPVEIGVGETKTIAINLDFVNY